MLLHLVRAGNRRARPPSHRFPPAGDSCRWTTRHAPAECAHTVVAYTSGRQSALRGMFPLPSIGSPLSNPPSMRTRNPRF